MRACTMMITSNLPNLSAIYKAVDIHLACCRRIWMSWAAIRISAKVDVAACTSWSFWVQMIMMMMVGNGLVAVCSGCHSIRIPALHHHARHRRVDSTSCHPVDRWRSGTNFSYLPPPLSSWHLNFFLAANVCCDVCWKLEPTKLSCASCMYLCLCGGWQFWSAIKFCRGI